MADDLPLTLRSLARLGAKPQKSHHVAEAALQCARHLQLALTHAGREAGSQPRASETTPFVQELSE